MLELLIELIWFVVEAFITLVLVLIELFLLIAVYLLRRLGYAWKAAPGSLGTGRLAAMSPIQRAMRVLSSLLLLALLAVLLWHYLR
jgi:hypothetical protein